MAARKALKGGQVHGDTGADGATSTRSTPHPTLFATLFKACGVDAHKLYHAPGHRKRYVSINGNATRRASPIAEFF